MSPSSRGHSPHGQLLYVDVEVRPVLGRPPGTGAAAPAQGRVRSPAEGPVQLLPGRRGVVRVARPVAADVGAQARDVELVRITRALRHRRGVDQGRAVENGPAQQGAGVRLRLLSLLRPPLETSN